MIRTKPYGMDRSNQSESPNCETCVISKQYRTESNRKLVQNSPEVTVRVEIIGSMPESSFDWKRYCLAMVKTLHGYVRMDLLRDRTSASEFIHEFIARVDRNAKQKTKRVHSDNAPEFISLQKGLARTVVELTTSTSYTSESNGLAAGTSRYLLDKMRAMLQYEKLDNRYCGKAMW